MGARRNDAVEHSGDPGNHRGRPPAPGRRPTEADAAFEGTPVSLARLAGPDLVFTAANAAFRTLLGEGDVVGRRLREVIPPGTEQDLATAVEQVHRTGQPASLVDHLILLDRGDHAPSELWVDGLSVPYRDESGDVAGVDCYAIDVTDKVLARRHAERRAETAESKYARAREVVVAMQDALLPHGVPILPHVDVAARYLLAEVDTRAGGDWFDAVVLDDGRLAVVVGDVVGHGVAASTVMGQLRAVLRAAICEHGDPQRAVEFVDRYAMADPAARSTSLVLAVLSVDADRVDYVTAGHPPPLLVGSDGTARFLPGSGSGTLGSGLPFEAASEPLGPGEMLLLYSDGLVERPGRTAPHNALELVTVTAEARSSLGGDSVATGAERVCEEVLDRLTRQTGYTDDISVLAVQRRDGPDGPGSLPDLSRTIDVVPGARLDVRDARAAVTAWLDSLGVGPADVVALTHAAHELVTNAVEHAYAGGADDAAPTVAAGPVPVPGRSGTVRVHGSVRRDGRVQLEVRDDGSWRAPVARSASAEDRGRGLAMAAALVDDLQVVGRPTGTRVTLTHVAERAATLLTGHFGTDSEHVGEFDLDESSEGERTTVVATGELDLAATSELESSLLSAPRGAGSELVVDLSEVTLLCSAAVQVLSEALSRDDRVGHGRTILVAQVGTPAQRVLDLVRLPHRTSRA
jgi:serine phosphatase RsbU (regulator of sigma subunit)/anti-sigma regulatory factor (Ser/Thr protein kinase)/anti-anti-sigma regulatory factor